MHRTRSARPVFFVLLLALVPAAAFRPQAERPRLVVVISVDQMRADYLDRFGALYHGGLARLSREGRVFTQARHDHAGTETAPGHATIATGRFPSHSGIIANNWYDRREGRAVYALDDSGSAIAGLPPEAGRSPKRVLTDALGDWLKRASPASKVVSVASKDRSAILMGGKQPDGAWWYNTSTGKYQTSAYYGTKYPAWIDSLNRENLADRHLQQGWSLLLPDSAYRLAGPDSVSQEHDGVHVTFPHLLDSAYTGSRARSYSELLYTPFAEELVLAFARGAVINEGLGADTVPDILWVGCSSGDYVGHRYGPSSREVEDYYLRLDQYLGEFFAFLDERVGAGRYSVVLTADHGVIPFPEELARSGQPARRLTRSGLSGDFAKVDVAAAKTLGIKGPIISGYLEGFILHYSAATARGIPAARVQDVVAKELKKLPYIADAFTATELAGRNSNGRPYFEQFQHSFYEGRSPDVLPRFKEYILFTNTDNVTGTSHGTPYDYDQRVPLVFLNAGMPAGRNDDRVRTVDLAPTVAKLLGITPPEDVDGKALN